MRWVILMLGWLWLAATPLGAQPEAVVGVVYPLSGPVAQVGKDAVAAMRMAVDIVNRETWLELPLAQGKGLPRLKGARLRMIVADHKGRPDVGHDEALRLVTRERVHALLGAFYSSVTTQLIQVAERFRIPLVNAASGAPGLTVRGRSWFFRTGPHDGSYSRLIFEFLRDFQDKSGSRLSTVGILNENTPWGSNNASQQNEFAQREGYRVAAYLTYPPRAEALLDEVSFLKRAAPDVLLPSSGPLEAVLFLNTAKEQEYSPAMLIARNGGFGHPSFLARVGRDAEGVITTSRFNPDLANRLPLLGRLNALFKKRTGRELSDVSIRAFISMLVLAEAIDRARSPEPEKIRRALTETDWPAGWLPLPWRGVRFAPNGQNQWARGILVQVQNGRYCTIYPFEVASCQVIYPMTTWAEKALLK